MYDTHITIVYTIQNDNGERVTKDIPFIADIENAFKNQESSFLVNHAEPKLRVLNYVSKSMKRVQNLFITFIANIF